MLQLPCFESDQNEENMMIGNINREENFDIRTQRHNKNLDD